MRICSIGAGCAPLLRAVLHARAAGLFATREPLQIGAEIYGHAGPEADFEMVDLMATSLQIAGVRRVRLDVCHAAVVPALMDMNPPSVRERVDEAELYRLLQQKDVPGLAQLLEPLEPASRAALLALPALYGAIGGSHTGARPDCLAVPGRSCPRCRPLQPWTNLPAGGLQLWQRHPGVELSADLADLRGYRYHSGRRFRRATCQCGRQVAGTTMSARRLAGPRGDRIFARTARAASLQASAALPGAVLAPWSDDPGLARTVADLRAAGEIVVRVLPGHEQEQQEFACDRELVCEGGAWRVRAL
jgi:ATP phosphoribosyltransferase regulatory subunit